LSSPPAYHPFDGEALGWPLERLLLTMTTVEDEQAAYASVLPDPKTRFQAASLEIWLEEPLFSFWGAGQEPPGQRRLRGGDRPEPPPAPQRGALLPI